MGLELDLSELEARATARSDVDDAGCVTPTARASGAGAVGNDSAGCFTPTSAASTLGPATVCPPAPRKPRPAKRKRCGRAPPRRFLFSVPHDLAAVYVARAATSPPLTPPSKKIRVCTSWGDR